MRVVEGERRNQKEIKKKEGKQTARPCAFFFFILFSFVWPREEEESPFISSSSLSAMMRARLATLIMFSSPAEESPGPG